MQSAHTGNVWMNKITYQSGSKMKQMNIEAYVRCQGFGHRLSRKKKVGNRFGFRSIGDKSPTALLATGYIATAL